MKQTENSERQHADVPGESLMVIIHGNTIEFRGESYTERLKSTVAVNPEDCR
jgi:hypothetical protein